MLRGSIVVFTFFLSMLILKQKKQPYSSLPLPLSQAPPSSSRSPQVSILRRICDIHRAHCRWHIVAFDSGTKVRQFASLNSSLPSTQLRAVPHHPASWSWGCFLLSPVNSVEPFKWWPSIFGIEFFPLRLSDIVDAQVFEEKQLKGRYQLSPAQVVGTEGCWGVIIMAGIVLPSMCAFKKPRPSSCC